MSKTNMPGFTAEASLYRKPARYQSIAKDYYSGQRQVVPAWWGGDLVDWIGGKLEEGADWVGGKICGNCAAVGLGAAAGCVATTEGLGLIGGTCGLLGGAVALGCNVGCGR
jgi:hypothetical protein